MVDSERTGGGGEGCTRHVVEELVDDVLEVRRADVLRQVERRAQVLPLGAHELAHDAPCGLAGRRRRPLVVHLVAWRRRRRRRQGGGRRDETMVLVWPSRSFVRC